MKSSHNFTGKWITDNEFYELPPRNVFHKQLETAQLPCGEHRNRHIIFRKKFICEDKICAAKLYISADDYYKLYVNGNFVAQGPAPSYHFQYNYNVIDVSAYLKEGTNTIAVHTLYQGLINRVWQSGDNRHGLILDLLVNDKLALSSDDTFRTRVHSGYREIGTVGYQTQFLEEYDSRVPEVGFYLPDFDDSDWENAKIHQFSDHVLTEQKSKMLEFETIYPVERKVEGQNCFFVDFGSIYVGYLDLTVKGKSGDTIVIRCGQELNDDGSVRFRLRANCVYEETWILSDGESTLDWFDYKSFRYAEIILPEGCDITNISMSVRHYPFELKTALKKDFADNENLRKVWELCIHTQKYGVQEVIQDCMEREKGFYVGDGCYTALTNMILTKDDSMVRKLIDDAFSSDFITDTLVTCLDCSFMQEIAEYPLMLIYLVLWHYRLTDDKEYLARNYPKVTKLLEAFRHAYEKDFLLSDLDKWCVVEWPKNFQDNYDVDVTENKVCHEAHVSINAYYIEAVKTANKIAELLGLEKYRDDEPLLSAFYNAFYDKEKHLFKDGINTEHVSIVGNLFPFAFMLCPDDTCSKNIISMLCERKISSVSLFCSFAALLGLVRNGREDLIRDILLDEGAWLRMLREGATTTFEGWGKDTKWNTSLFHLTMSYASVFMADIHFKKIFM